MFSVKTRERNGINRIKNIKHVVKCMIPVASSPVSLLSERDWKGGKQIEKLFFMWYGHCVQAVTLSYTMSFLYCSSTGHVTKS